MKKIITLLLVCTATIAFAQKVKDNDVPQVVKDALHKMYPDAKVSEWEKEAGNYEAEFMNNNVETVVILTSTGAHVATEVEIATSQLPSGVNDYVKKNLAGQKINEACKITSATGAVSYEVEVGKDDYIFDANGNYVEKEGEDDDDDDDDDK